MWLFYIFFYYSFSNFSPKNYTQVFVEVVVAEPPNFFRMLVSKCWATQYNHPNNTNGSQHILIQNGWECIFISSTAQFFSELQLNKWTFITLVPPFFVVAHRCAKDHTVLFNNQQANGANGQSSTVHFHFEMFRFTTEPDQLFLHCVVQLCEPNDQESCKPVSSRCRWTPIGELGRRGDGLTLFLLLTCAELSFSG